MDKAIADRQGHAHHRPAQVEAIIDDLLVDFGLEILKIVPGRVSTEIDARLSFDTEGTRSPRARTSSGSTRSSGIPRERILIKIASTWEGIRAAEVLQKEGINCNLTLLFSLAAGRRVRRGAASSSSRRSSAASTTGIKRAPNKRDYAGAEDPGVQSVTRFTTTTRNSATRPKSWARASATSGEITELAGCDLLTISPRPARRNSPNPPNRSRASSMPTPRSKTRFSASARREDLPLAVQRRRHGHGKNRRRHPQIRRGHREA